ncbi:unnamed protein product [Aphanomyces euteiches]|nr:hypothetical protein Ae201684P_011082 [Aphanomyces euteiches]KAH9135671.1 hypothetical protein AeRB84_018975 [Aphanomyces euteiches]
MSKRCGADADGANTAQNIRAAASANKSFHAVDGVNEPSVRVTPLSAIGFNTNVRDMLTFINKNEIVFAAGKFVVLQHLHNQKTAFFEPPFVAGHAATRLGDVCAIAITPKRNKIAIARSAHSGLHRTESSIAIYSLQSNSVHVSETSSLEPIRALTYDTHSFSSLAFSHDGTFIVGQSTTSEWTFVIWDWMRARRVATADAHAKVTRIAFNPVDVAQVSTSGGVHLRLWRLAEPTCRPFATFHSANSAVRFVDHAWVGKSDGIVAILDNGDVQYFSHGELIRTIPSLHHGHMLQCVQSFMTSVVVGGDRGWISVLEIDTFQGNDMHMTRRMRLDTKETILALSIDAAGAGFICATPSTYGAYDLSNMCLLREDDEDISLILYSPLPRLSTMSSMAVSSRKHLIATTGKRFSGTNHSVCLYGQVNCTGVLHHAFQHMIPSCLDFHPSGHEVLVSFSAEVHIYHVLCESLKLAFEIDVKHASTVAYSGGGNYFCVLVDDKSVYVYRSFGSTEPLLVGICPVNEANVTSLRWGVDDTRFYTADDMGSMIEWSVGTDGFFATTQKTTTRTIGLLDRPLAYTTIASMRNPATGTPTIAASFVTDDDKSSIHVWWLGHISDTPIKSKDIDAKIVALEFGSSGVICAGTSDGSLLVFSWEMDKTTGVQRIVEPIIFDLSPSSIFSLRQTNMALLASTVNGSIFSLALEVHKPMIASREATKSEITTRSLLQSSACTHFTVALSADELCLVDRASISEKNLRITDLETEKEQIKTEKDILVKLNAEQLNLAERERQNELLVVKTALEAKLKAAEDEMQAKAHDAHSTLLAMKKDHEKSLQTMQSIFATKLSSMNETCRELERQLTRERERVDDAVFGGEEKMAVVKQDLESTHTKQLAEIQAKVDSLTKVLKLKESQYDELLMQQNEDHLFHVTSIQAAIERGRVEHGHQAESAKNSISSLQQQLRMMLNAMNTKDEQMSSLKADYLRLQKTVEALQNELVAEQTKAAKAVAESTRLEAQVAEQTRQIESLEELNNVRLCKLKTLKQTIATKEQEVQDMRVIVEELHEENSSVVQDANAMDDAQAQMQRKVRFYERTMVDQKKQLADVKAVVAAFHRDLGTLIEDDQHGHRLKIDAVVKLYYKYDPSNRKGRVIQREMASEEAIIQELSRQNKCVEDHRRKMRQRLESMTQERQKLVSVFSTDNTKLLRELNAMTRRNRDLQQQIVMLQLELNKKSGSKRRLDISASTPELKEPEVDEHNNNPEPTITTNVSKEPPIYIPCGLSADVREQLVPKTLSEPLKQVQRPRSSKPRAVATPEAVVTKAKPRPKSAHPTK